MKKLTLLIIVGLNFGISGLAQSAKKPAQNSKNFTSAEKRSSSTLRSANSLSAQNSDALNQGGIVAAKTETSPKALPAQSQEKAGASRNQQLTRRAAPALPARANQQRTQAGAKRPASAARGLDGFFNKLDLNKDGKISKSEFQFIRLDKNSDGKLSKEELIGS